MKLEDLDMEEFLDQAARLQQITIESTHRPGVIANLHTLSRMADLVMSNPHDESEEELAPVFQP